MGDPVAETADTPHIKQYSDRRRGQIERQQLLVSVVAYSVAKTAQNGSGMAVLWHP